MHALLWSDGLVVSVAIGYVHRGRTLSQQQCYHGTATILLLPLVRTVDVIRSMYHYHFVR